MLLLLLFDEHYHIALAGESITVAVRSEQSKIPQQCRTAGRSRPSIYKRSFFPVFYVSETNRFRLFLIHFFFFVNNYD